MSGNTENNATAEKIVEAATMLWSQKGYEEVTMRELARRLGMGVSSLYFYFRSREEIVQFLYHKLNKQILEEFRANDKGERNLANNLARYMRIKLDKLAPHRSCLIALIKETIDPNSSLNPMSKDSDDVRSMNIDLFKDLVGRSGAVAQDQVGDTASALWLANLGIILYWIHDKSHAYENTFTLIEKTGNMIGLLPMLGKMPGANTTLKLFSALVEKQSSGTPQTQVQQAESLRHYDVVVIGGGPIAMVYSSFLKLKRPKTRILVLEKHAEPGHKIGESTLSGFCKALRTIGIKQEAMETLFYPKNGLGFFAVDESTRDLRSAPEYILETFDRTYQVERRVLDSLLIAHARNSGIEVVQGANVDLSNCTLSAKGNVVTYSIGNHSLKVRSSLVVDASGPAGLIAKQLGLWSTEGLPFQTSAVWSYWRGIKTLGSYQNWPSFAQFPRDQYTEHVCLREGWLWYIPIVSWQAAPASNLSFALDACLRPMKAVPTRERLLEEYGCPNEDITSIGLVLRNDRDRFMKDDAREAFEHYKRKYPAIAQLLDGAELIPDPYGTGQTFMQRLSFRGYSRQVSGDGWLLVGDAAFFVDPLISPGLTGGTACAYRAAEASVKALEKNIFVQSTFADYDSFVRTLHVALERDNQLVYMSFNHPNAIKLVQQFQEIDARRHFMENSSGPYGEADTNVWGILDPDYQALQKRAWKLLRDAEMGLSGDSIDEQSHADYEGVVKGLQKLLADRLRSNLDLTPYAKANTLRAEAESKK